MARMSRAINGYMRSRSLQPIWLGTIAFVLILYYVAFDAKSLFTIKLQDSKITINVAQYQVKDADRKATHERDLAILWQQVERGEKPKLVMDLEGIPQWTSRIGLNRGRGSVSDLTWKKMTADIEYPVMHEINTFSILPPFSEVVCWRDLSTRIPNVVHYIWFGKLELTFSQYLSIRSAATVQQPASIILHTDGGEPKGKYWESLIAEIPCLEVRYLPRPAKLFGKYSLDTVQQQSHVSRLKLLFEEGGIYANLNVIFVRRLDSLLHHSFVLGKEEEKYYSNSVILAERGAPFITLWFQSYNRKIADWATYSIYMPWRLHQGNPDVPLHVEEFSMMRPNFNEDEWITQRNWELANSFCVHLYTSRERIKNVISQHPLGIIGMDNTYGQLARISLFGTPYLDKHERDLRESVHSILQCPTSDNFDETSIPNIVHYVLEDDTFTYKHYLSVRSAARVIEPSTIFIHLFGNLTPDNYYWVRLKQEISCIEEKQDTGLNLDRSSGDMVSSHANHVKDILLRYGGIFLSFDIIVTNQMWDLMENSVVIGTDALQRGNLDVIMSEKNSNFLLHWFSWSKEDSSVIEQKIQQYTKQNPKEAIEIFDHFPARLGSDGGDSHVLNYKDHRCIKITESNSELERDDVDEYQLLRSNSLSGQIVRIALFEDDSLLE